MMGKCGFFDGFCFKSSIRTIGFIAAVFLMISSNSYASTVIKSTYNFKILTSSQVMSTSLLHLILTLLATLLLISLVILYFSLKLKRVNKELAESNKMVMLINNDLQRTNTDLASQKENIARKHYESEKFYEKLVHSANDGISFYDSDWNLKYANSAFYSLIGLSEKAYQLLSQHDLDELIHSEDKNYHSLRKQNLVDNGFFESELRIRHPEGYYVNLSTRSVTVRDDNGEVLGALTISRDITRLKQVHEELIKANIDAEASNRLKTSFLANISHEIRTPLNSVVGFSNLLLASDIPDKVKEEYIENINHNSEKLLQIIGDIIDLSRLESAQIEITYEETSLSSIVNEIIDEARKVIRRNEKSIILNVKNNFEDSTDLIFTDRLWLKRVLNHLMDNAVKFTLDGSVEFSYLRENENIVFKIRDTGIGINKENLGRIFEEFRQEIDGHHRPFEGLGIGLTLAKEVVERMGGRISVQSEKGIGSEFSFVIPYRPAGSTGSKFRSMNKENSLSSINWSSRKCLLVDDNKDVLIYLNRILLDTGVTILTARSGFEALELIKSTPDIDVVLLDMQMPEMNGIEATKEIRKIRKNLPIIAQTAFIFEDDKDIILEAGCDACLIKPIRKDHLLTVMSSFVKPN
jgi:PAS domain S-box-containing protein